MQHPVSSTASAASAAPTLRPAVAQLDNTTPLAVLGTQVKLLLTGKDTGGAYATYEIVCQPGAGSPPHVHADDDEAFHVVEGEFEVMCGGQVSVAGPGTSVLLPRHIPHYFRCVGDKAGRLLGMCTPAGHEGFFLDASHLRFPPDPQAAVAHCHKYGIELVAPGK